MRSHDGDHVLFIIDNAHNADESCNDLVMSWGEIRKARILLVSRPIEAGPPDESYLDLLRSETVELELEDKQLEEVLDVFTRWEQVNKLDIGDKQIVLEKCAGDLHLLHFYFLAWGNLRKLSLCKLSEVSEDQVLESVYKKYLSGKLYVESLAVLAALTQFEIPVEAAWFDNDLEALRSDSLVDYFESQVEKIPLLQIYHATPAAYIFKAYVKSRYGLGKLDAWVFKKLKDYLQTRPHNFFSVFQQLYRNECVDLQQKLFACLPLEDIFKEYLGNSDEVFSSELPQAMGFIQNIWNWQNRDHEGLAFCLLGHLGQRLEQTEFEILKQLNLEQFNAILRVRKIAPKLVNQLLKYSDFKALGARSQEVGLLQVGHFLKLTLKAGVVKKDLHAFAGELDFKALGIRSQEVGLSTLRNFLQLAHQVGISHKDLHVFAKELDFKALGAQSQEVGLATLSNFLQMAHQVGVSQKDLHTFAKEFDFKALGARSRNNGLTKIQHFLHLAHLVGVVKKDLNAFAGELDFQALGARSGNLGLWTVINFLQLAHQINVPKNNLLQLCEKINWTSLGQKIISKQDQPVSSLLLIFHLLLQDEITDEMAEQFVQGIGWEHLICWSHEIFSLDVLAAFRDLLLHKCKMKPELLNKLRGLDFKNKRLWLQSLLHPIRDSQGRQYIQNRYLKKASMEFIDKKGLKELLNEIANLEDLNILIHNLENLENLEIVQANFLRNTVEFYIRSWSLSKWQSLVDTADLGNLGIFLSRFSSCDGIFQWSLPADLDFSRVDLKEWDDQILLTKLAHLLFIFYSINRPDASHGLALKLEEQSELMQHKFKEATLGELDFFLWNYWLALPLRHSGELFQLPVILEGMLSKIDPEMRNEADLLGLLGCLHLSGADGIEEIKKHLRLKEALFSCNQWADQRCSPRLIRSLIGLSLVKPKLENAECNHFLEALDNIDLEKISIPNQTKALDYLKEWLKSCAGLLPSGA